MANKPKEMKFTIDGFAQRNILKYKDDDTVKGNYSGEITCLISSLEKSREMAELKFAGCDMRGITAFIRLYKYDGEGKAELQKFNQEYFSRKTMEVYQMEPSHNCRSQIS